MKQLDAPSGKTVAKEVYRLMHLRTSLNGDFVAEFFGYSVQRKDNGGSSGGGGGGGGDSSGSGSSSGSNNQQRVVVNFLVTRVSFDISSYAQHITDDRPASDSQRLRTAVVQQASSSGRSRVRRIDLYCWLVGWWCGRTKEEKEKPAAPPRHPPPVFLRSIDQSTFCTLLQLHAMNTCTRHWYSVLLLLLWLLFIRSSPNTFVCWIFPFQMVRGMQFLHRGHGFAHGCLKPLNVGVQPDGTVFYRDLVLDTAALVRCASQASPSSASTSVSRPCLPECTSHLLTHVQLCFSCALAQNNHGDARRCLFRIVCVLLLLLLLLMLLLSLLLLVVVIAVVLMH